MSTPRKMMIVNGYPRRPQQLTTMTSDVLRAGRAGRRRPNERGMFAYSAAELDETDVAEIRLYDEVGIFGVSADQFAWQLAAIGPVGTVRVRINSPGGEVHDGIAMFNSLRAITSRVVVHVDGLAASAASVIAMAGDEVVMETGSQMMIHDAMGMTFGNAEEHRSQAKLLDGISETIAKIYADRAGGQARSWRKRMLDETWYSADEAVAAGLADRATSQPRRGASASASIGNQWDLSAFRFAGRAAAPPPEVDPAGRPVAVTPPVVADPPMPVAPLSAFDLRQAIHGAAGVAPLDEIDFHSVIEGPSLAAPSLPVPAPAAPAHTLAEEPEPEPPAPEPTAGQLFADAVDGVSRDAPALPVPVPAAPTHTLVEEPEPEPPAPEPVRDERSELLRAAIDIAGQDAPVPADISRSDISEKDHLSPEIDLVTLSSALREAVGR